MRRSRASLDAPALSFAPERSHVYPKNRGGLIEGAALREHAQDILALALLEPRSIPVRVEHTGRSLTHGVGQIVRRDRVRVRQGHCAFQGVAKLADVSRPSVVDERLSSVRREGKRSASASRAGLPEHPLHQRKNVLNSLAQRREPKCNYVEPIVQVLAKASRRDFVLQVAAGGCDDPNIYPNRSITAGRFDAVFLNEAKKLCLESRYELGDLVEKHRWAPSRLAAAGLIVHRGGKGPAHVSEKLTLQSLVRQSCAIGYDERPLAPRAPSMNLSCEDVLAGTALPREQYGCVARRGPRRSLQELAHFGIARFEERQILGRLLRKPGIDRFDMVRFSNLHDFARLRKFRKTSYFRRRPFETSLSMFDGAASLSALHSACAIRG